MWQMERQKYQKLTRGPWEERVDAVSAATWYVLQNGIQVRTQNQRTSTTGLMVSKIMIKYAVVAPNWMPTIHTMVKISPKGPALRRMSCWYELGVGRDERTK